MLINDDTTDAKGRWWAGSMALNEEDLIGWLWCFDEGPGETRPASVRELDNLLETRVPRGPV